MPPIAVPDPSFVRDAATLTLRLRTDLVCTLRDFGGRPCYVIEDPLRSKFYRLGAAEFTFISLLDGRTTLADAVRLASGKLGPQAFTEHEALAIARWLVETQLASTLESESAGRLATAAESAKVRRAAASLNPLAIRVRLVNPDRLLDRIMPWCGWLLSRPAVALWCIVVMLGLWTVALNWDEWIDHAAIVFDPANWLRLAAAWTALKIVHEFFHALACKKFGGNVTRAGVMLLFFAPVAYTDVTSSWRFRSKWQRIAVAAAGMYVELFVAAVAIIMWSRGEDGLAHRLAYDVALMASVGSLAFNLNPLMRFDGYYILADLVGIPNLYVAGRQSVGSMLKRQLIGWETPPLNRSPRTERFLLAYGFGSLAWLGLVYLGLALLAIGLFSYVGGAMVVLFATLTIGVPAWRGLQTSLRSGAFEQCSKWRVARTALVTAAAIAILAWLVTQPGRIEAPAVVEYAPLTQIRAGAPGFVRQVLVRSGDSLEVGQVILVQDNPELTAELADLRLALTQATARARGYSAEHELAKFQVETTDREAIEKRVAELSRQANALSVRSPVAGRIVGRQLSSLVGQYLRQGAEIAVVGDEGTKELVVAAAQDDLASFQTLVGHEVQVRIAGGEVQRASLQRIEPRAELDLPHAALSSRANGPLPVKEKLTPSRQRAGEADEHGELAEHDELLRPCFKAIVALPAVDAAGLRAGQRASIRFATPIESVGSRLARQVQQWIQDRLAKIKPASSSAA